MLKTVNSTYNLSSPSPFPQVDLPDVPVNVVPLSSTTILANGSESQTTYSYDNGFTYTNPNPYLTGNFHGLYGKVLQKNEYDYGMNSPGALLRSTATSYLAFANANYLALNILNPVSSIAVSAGTQQSSTLYNYDENTLVPSDISTMHDSAPWTGAHRGNITSVHRWLNGNSVSTTNCPVSGSNGYLISYNIFFDTGMVNKSTDSCGSAAGDAEHTTTYAYSSAYAGALPTTVTNPLGQSTTDTYDFNSGLLASTKDSNNQTTSYGYDTMWNRVSTNYPDGGNTTVNYNGYALPLTVTTTVAASPDPSIVSSFVYDPLGRPTTATGSNGATTDTAYDLLGRVISVSNPHFTSSSPTDGITSYAYDALGRKLLQCQPDNGKNTPCQPGSSYLQWAYTGNVTDSYDENSHHWQRTTDALGRLTKVLEPDSGNNPTVETDYAYDALGNLLRVDQWGGPHGSSGDRVRTFSYDPLSRLASSTNPESGTTSYTYDADGNMVTKTDARNITASYSYDSLNRMLIEQASGITYTYSYDISSTPYGFTSQNPVGRLVEISNAVNASTQYGYDSMGRIVYAANCIPSNCTQTGNEFQAVYDQAGQMITLTYPDGRALNYKYSPAGQIQSISQTSVPTPYLNVLSIWPTGAWESASFGNGTTESDSYNNRLQPTELSLLNGGTKLADRQYSWIRCAQNSSDNGNVCAVTDLVNAAHDQAYGYDTLSRILAGAQADNSFNETFTYDPWGNVKQSGTWNFLPNYNAANQITNFGVVYDAAGNMTRDASATTYTYDSEGKITSASSGGSYTYLPGGVRVRKDVGSNWTEYIQFNGNTLTEKNSDSTWTDYVFAGGKRIAQFNHGSATPIYHWADHLGSIAVVTDNNGGLLWQGTFAPYGQPGSSSGAVPTHYEFTGKERDSESGNDYFGARYYGSSMGRFLSPDDGSGQDAGNLESWNLYGYVRNNPLSNVDPDGHDCINTQKTGDGRNSVVVTNVNETLCTGTYVPGTVVGPVQFNSTGTAIYNFTRYDTGMTDSGAFTLVTAAAPDGSGLNLSRPQDLQGLQMLSATDKVVNFLGGLETWILAPWAAAAGQCASGASAGACAANMALAVVPEAGALREGAALLRAAEDVSADKFIAQYCKGSINREFPGQFRGSLIKDIKAAAKGGNVVARKAMKLLTDSRFRK